MHLRERHPKVELVWLLVVACVRMPRADRQMAWKEDAKDGHGLVYKIGGLELRCDHLTHKALEEAHEVLAQRRRLPQAIEDATTIARRLVELLAVREAGGSPTARAAQCA